MASCVVRQKEQTALEHDQAATAAAFGWRAAKPQAAPRRAVPHGSGDHPLARAHTSQRASACPQQRHQRLGQPQVRGHACAHGSLERLWYRLRQRARRRQACGEMAGRLSAQQARARCAASEGRPQAPQSARLSGAAAASSASPAHAPPAIDTTWSALPASLPPSCSTYRPSSAAPARLPQSARGTCSRPSSAPGSSPNSACTRNWLAGERAGATTVAPA